MEQPKIPTLKDAQKPQVKVKGMGAGLTIFDRLKQFKKKDLAFILAGMGTLFMAPLAEHFMMAPENGDASLQQGWGKGGTGSNLFGSGSSPYESGNNNIASGGAIGGGGDIITPLNVRDPSSLVMGPGGTQQPPAGSAAPAVAPPTAPSPRSETDYKDALAGAASRAASAAVKKAPLPVPKVALGGSGLRGLGVAGGGTSASGSLAPINSGNLGQAGTGGGGLNMVRPAPGFRGAAGPRSPTGGTGLDNTKKAGQNAGDAFSRTGSALSGLNAAASEQIPTGGQGFGGGGQGGSGANDKPYGGSGPGGSKSVGESLAFIEAKERMMENMKLEFEKRKLKDPELLMYGIRNDMVKAAATKLGEGLTSWGMCKGLGMGCPPADSEYECGEHGSPMSTANMTPACGGKDSPKTTDCWTGAGGPVATLWKNQTAGAVAMQCTRSGKGKDAAGQNTQTGTTGAGVIGGNLAPTPAQTSVNTLCTTLTGIVNEFTQPTRGGVRAAGGAATKEAYEKMRENAAYLLEARNSLVGGSPDGTCGVKGSAKNAAQKQHPLVEQALVDATAAEPGVVPNLLSAVAKTPETGQAELKKAQDKIPNVKTLLDDAQAQLDLGEDALDDLDDFKFELPLSDRNNSSLSGLGQTFTSANTLKDELVAYIAEGKKRQEVLVAAKDSAEKTAKEGATASLILATNDEFEKMKKSIPGLTLPDIEALPAQSGGAAPPPAAPAPKTYAEVETAIGDAKTAILQVCGGKPCEVPAAPAPDAAAPAPVEPNRYTTAANNAVKAMREAQRGYLGAIQTAVKPAVPVTGSGTGTTTP